MKTHQATEDVIFWKWINPKMIGLVTETSVFHWSLEGDGAPTKVFERHSTLASNQIISYKTDADMKFLLLLGIAAKVSHFVGSTNTRGRT